jgi:hypothetical protein
MGYSGKCLFLLETNKLINFYTAYNAYFYFSINFITVLPMNIYFHILFVFCCTLNTVYFQGYSPCYKCSNAYAQDFRENGALLLILKTFIWCTCQLHTTQKVWCFQLACSSRTVTPTGSSLYCAKQKSCSYLSYMLTIFIHLTCLTYQSLIHSFSHPCTSLIYVGFFPSLKCVYTHTSWQLQFSPQPSE